VDKTAIRHAATIILVRDPQTAPKILMGQRGANAAFMPNKFVFPGGAVDVDDATIPLAQSPSDPCAARLAQDADGDLTHALYVAAIRELWEETGLAMGRPGTWPDGDTPSWEDFKQLGLVPDPTGLHFVFRAITPPKRPRRFDARFFLAMFATSPCRSSPRSYWPKLQRLFPSLPHQRPFHSSTTPAKQAYSDGSHDGVDQRNRISNKIPKLSKAIPPYSRPPIFSRKNSAEAAMEKINSI